jgi:uncharacterized protein YjbI with pentapeptide repeats
MANPEHEKHLNRPFWLFIQSQDRWNRWRKENPDVAPDLRAAFLHERDLQGHDFSGADLRQANFVGASLRYCRFWKARLDGAHMNSADLSRADLRDATLDDTDLTQANLTKAILVGANFADTNLGGTIFGDQQPGQQAFTPGGRPRLRPNRRRQHVGEHVSVTQNLGLNTNYMYALLNYSQSQVGQGPYSTGMCSSDDITLDG